MCSQRIKAWNNKGSCRDLHLENPRAVGTQAFWASGGQVGKRRSWWAQQVFRCSSELVLLIVEGVMPLVCHAETALYKLLSALGLLFILECWIGMGRVEMEGMINRRWCLCNEQSPQPGRVGLVHVVLGSRCLRNPFNCHTEHNCSGTAGFWK